MSRLRLWSAVTFIVLCLGAGVVVAVSNTRAIQHQRSQSIVDDCVASNQRHAEERKTLEATALEQPGDAATIRLILTVLPQHVNCQALVTKKVK